MKSRVIDKESAPSFGELFAMFKDSIEPGEGGAIVTFTGVVRKDTREENASPGTTPGPVPVPGNGATTTAIEIEYIDGVSDQALQSIASRMEARPGISKVAIIHLAGKFGLGEPMVHVFVRGAHRQEAFKTLEDTVNAYKKEAPLWKKEHFSDGNAEWVHH